MNDAITPSSFTRPLHVAVAGLLCAAGAAHAQADYSAYGVLDLSYGRFEASGQLPRHRFNSNSLTASFVGVNAQYGLDGGWTPGITLEAFVRFQDQRLGRKNDDPLLSRNAFVSLVSPYGTLRAGRLQTLLFDTTSRFNALGNSLAFSPAMRAVFAAGNLEGVQGDFYWDRAVGYASPSLEGVRANVMYGQGAQSRRGDYWSGNVIASRGLFSVALAAQRVHFGNGIDDPTIESAWQLGATYNFGYARVFGLYTATRDSGLDVRSRTASVGTAVALGPGDLLIQYARTLADGPAVDRKHSATSLAYVYPYDSEIDLYAAGLDDRVRGQTRGLSYALGVRWRF